MASRPILTLAEYLQRLPRCLRDALLWSPAIAAAYFAYGQHPTYFLSSANRRLLRRPEDERGAFCFPIAEDKEAAAAAAVQPFTFGTGIGIGSGDGAAANVWHAPLRTVRDREGRIIGYEAL